VDIVCDFGIFGKKHAIVFGMSLSSSDFERLHTFYADALKEYGPTDARSVQWADAKNQQKRFEVLMAIAPLADKSVLDVGCGLGDLYKLFLQKQIPVNYTGIDIVPEFIATAAQRFPDATFQCKDISVVSKQYDYVLASGALSFKVEGHVDFYKDMIKHLYSLAREGVAFNMLDNSIHIDDNTYAAYSPHDIGDFCKTFCEHVEIVTGYLPQDFTIYLYRNSGENRSMA
jgi:SAM-dependent methyltransferase